MLTPLLASFDVTVVTVGLPALIVSICGMLVAAYLVLLISKAPKGNEKVQEISQAIAVRTVISRLLQQLFQRGFVLHCRSVRKPSCDLNTPRSRSRLLLCTCSSQRL